MTSHMELSLRSSGSDEKIVPFYFSCKATNSEYFTTILSVLQMEKDKQKQVEESPKRRHLTAVYRVLSLYLLKTG